MLPVLSSVDKQQFDSGSQFLSSITGVLTRNREVDFLQAEG